MMRVAYIFDVLEPTGGDRISYHHWAGLVKAGHLVDIYARGRLDSCSREIGTWEGDEPPRLMREHGAEFHLYESGKLGDGKWDGYDLVVAHGLNGAREAVAIRHPRKVWFLQNFDPYVFGPSKDIDRVYEGFGAYLLYCHDLATIVRKYYGDKKFYFCSNGVEYGKLSAYQKAGEKPGRTACFMAAYYRPYKGPRLADRVFAELRRRGFRTVEINATAGPLPNSDEYLKNPSFELKASTVAGCSVSIHPSAFETWGLVPMESMALGTPVVGTNSRGIMEYATSGNSVIVEGRDPMAVADAVEALLADKERYLSVQAEGIGTARAHDWKDVLPGIEKVYMEMARQ